MKSTHWGGFARLLLGLAFAAVGFLTTSPDTSDVVKIIGISLVGLAAIYSGLRMLSMRKRDREAVKTSAASSNGGAVSVSHDDDSITVTFPDGHTQSLHWNALTKVAIRTTDEGPFVDDVFWEFYVGDALKLTYPQDADIGHGLLNTMQKRLPGFDNEAVVKAMGATSNANFIAWQRVA